MTTISPVGGPGLVADGVRRVETALAIERVAAARTAVHADRPRSGPWPSHHARCVDLVDALESYAALAALGGFSISRGCQNELRLFRQLVRHRSDQLDR